MKKILIVDDEELICWALEFTFLKEGYEVSVAISGESAINKIKKTKFDLVITDYKLGKTTGVDVIKYIYERNLSTKIILMSAYYSELKKKGLDLQRLNFIQKPFEITEVKDIVQNVFCHN